MKRTIVERIDSWRAGATPRPPRAEVVNRYAWGPLIAAVATVLDTV